MHRYGWLVGMSVYAGDCGQSLKVIYYEGMIYLMKSKQGIIDCWKGNHPAFLYARRDNLPHEWIKKMESCMKRPASISSIHECCRLRKRYLLHWQIIIGFRR